MRCMGHAPQHVRLRPRPSSLLSDRIIQGKAARVREDSAIQDVILQSACKTGPDFGCTLGQSKARNVLVYDTQHISSFASASLAHPFKRHLVGSHKLPLALLLECSLSVSATSIWGNRSLSRYLDVACDQDRARRYAHFPSCLPMWRWKKKLIEIGFFQSPERDPLLPPPGWIE